MESKTLNNLSMLVGRAMLASIFIVAGIGKLGNYAGTQGYMESVGLPAVLLSAVILLEIAGGVALLVGFRTRTAALLLGGFTLLATVIFHSDFSQPMQMILFMKNIAITGAFLLLFAQGPGEWTFNPRLWSREV